MIGPVCKAEGSVAASSTTFITKSTLRCAITDPTQATASWGLRVPAPPPSPWEGPLCLQVRHLKSDSA